MVPEKRNILAICGALAVAFALPGCAPAGYNSADYAAGGATEAQPAANAVEATPEPEVSEEAGDDAKAEKAAPELTDEELTNKLIATDLPKMGEAVTDEKGWILYRFDKDTPKPAVSNCAGKCADTWPPALTDGDPELEGISSDLVGTVQRADGTRQITLDGWPLYRYKLDKKPGEWKGQGVGKTWFVVAPDGSRNVECLPPGVEAPGSGGGEATDKDAGSDDATDKDAGSDDKGAEADKGAGGDYNY